ncbi:ATP-binding protein [Granulicella arctica]|uniref:Signal transduction histidine kinase n=1 Tax=Granulicella arctica TaxID=940613 RepID=A0A7Y9PGX8_9BACT|nr:HAMP domain-containing sensor histidine kinase [Granulicella arctica]NYF79687.1 signal transduction histidine kinase [Granulicella arctica]
MQATLSRTASGKQFRSGTHTAVLPFLSADTFEAGDGSDAGLTREAQDKHAHSVAEGAGLAHDAGNLLGALGLYCELLALPGVLRDEHRHYADELQMLSGRSRVLIERLLHPAATARGRDVAQGFARPVEMVVVPEVIEQCRGLLDRIARRAVEVAYEEGSSAPVGVSREALERILVNLTKNAAEASDGGAAIMLRVSCLRARADGAADTVRDRIVLSVEDRGCGMSLATVKVLLGAGAEAPVGPRGIGFRVVRELVGASGGRLRLRSRTGGEVSGTSGTTVEIEWAVAGVELPMVVNALEERRRLMVVARGRAAGRMSC